MFKGGIDLKDTYRILVINPGSTSTKIAVFENETAIVSESIKHSTEDLRAFNDIWEQYDYRKSAIINEIAKHGFNLKYFDVIACRGGNTKPIEGGIYLLNEDMLKDMKSGLYGKHATNVGGLISYDLGKALGIPVITLDPPVTDELCKYARYTGIPLITRQSSFHALNQKATARKVAEKLGKSYQEVNMIVAHMGGGISIGAHEKGRVIDVNNALDGDGPFSPERAGSVPTGDLVKLCYSGRYREDEVLKMLTGKGGLTAHLNSNSGLEIEEMIKKGNDMAKEIYLTMAYQVAKEIGAAAAALKGELDAIAFTGSLAYSELLMNTIKEYVGFLAPIYMVPGENEMEALAAGAMRYLSGTEMPKVYQ